MLFGIILIIGLVVTILGVVIGLIKKSLEPIFIAMAIIGVLLLVAVIFGSSPSQLMN